MRSLQLNYNERNHIYNAVCARLNDLRKDYNLIKEEHEKGLYLEIELSTIEQYIVECEILLDKIIVIL